MVPSQLAWNAHNCVGKFYYCHYLSVTVHQCPRATFRTRSPCVKCNAIQPAVLHGASCRQIPGPHMCFRRSLCPLCRYSCTVNPLTDHHGGAPSDPAQMEQLHLQGSDRVFQGPTTTVTYLTSPLPATPMLSLRLFDRCLLDVPKDLFMQVDGL